MAMVHVWNISDDPTTKVTGRTLMVLGRNVAPGRYVRVPEARLTNAHKLNKDIAAGLFYVGRKPPQGYLDAKKPPRATFPKGHGRAHGPVAAVTAPTVEEAPEKVVEPAEVTEVKDEAVEETVEETAEDSSLYSSSSRSSRKGRGSRS